MINLFKRLVKEEEGQGMVEYALILALIAIVVIGAVGGIGEQANLKFEEIWKKLGGTPS